jgi:flavin reductase (DIM6/NTAB) family NADH-FMN oxidoreductase RutF
MKSNGPSDLRRAVGRLPTGLYVMTAAFENKRSGTLVTSVGRCADEPLLICVASRKGHPIEPLIRDSHRFAVCLLEIEDKLTARHFEHPGTPEDRVDPFDSLEVTHLVGHAPVLKKAALALDCDVFRHFDLDADHELYIGHVLGARVGPHKG